MFFRPSYRFRLPHFVFAAAEQNRFRAAELTWLVSLSLSLYLSPPAEKEVVPLDFFPYPCLFPSLRVAFSLPLFTPPSPSPRLYSLVPNSQWNSPPHSRFRLFHFLPIGHRHLGSRSGSPPLSLRRTFPFFSLSLRESLVQFHR